MAASKTPCLHKKDLCLPGEDTKVTLRSAETVPCVAVKLEDGVGASIPKLKPALGRGGRGVSEEQTAGAAVPVSVTFHNSFAPAALEELTI